MTLAIRPKLLPILLCLLGSASSLACGGDKGTESAYWDTEDTTIRILVLYTPDAAADMAADGLDPETWADYLVELTNDTLGNSSVSHRLALAGPEEISTSESDIPTSGTLTTTEVHAWLEGEMADSTSEISSARDLEAADLVMLLTTELTTSDGATGMAHRTTGDSGDDPEEAGGVNRYSSDLGFVHEVGHLLGGNHDVYQLDYDGEDTSGYNHGITDLDVVVYTIMAYSNECGSEANPTYCEQVPYFSNPNISFYGATLGDSSTAYNACVFEQFGGYVAMFYEFLDGEPRADVTLDSSCPYTLTDTSDVEGDRCFGTGAAIGTDADLAIYEGCAWIAGTLTISEGVTTLEPLDLLQQVDGDLEIESSSITTLAPLASLATVGGSLTISGTSVTSLSGLESLTSVEGLTLSDNDSLAAIGTSLAISSLTEDLAISDNDAILGLTGFESLTEIGGNLMIWWNDSLLDLTGLENVGSVGGGISVLGNASLTDCSSLAGASTGTGTSVIGNADDACGL